jgi:hypothetical protein
MPCRRVAAAGTENRSANPARHRRGEPLPADARINNSNTSTPRKALQDKAFALFRTSSAI